MKKSADKLAIAYVIILSLIPGTPGSSESYIPEPCTRCDSI